MGAETEMGGKNFLSKSWSADSAERVHSAPNSTVIRQDRNSAACQARERGAEIPAASAARQLGLSFPSLQVLINQILLNMKETEIGFLIT